MVLVTVSDVNPALPFLVVMTMAPFEAWLP